MLSYTSACLRTRSFNFHTLVKFINAHALNLPPKAPLWQEHKLFLCVFFFFTRKLTHNHYTLQVRVRLYWEFTSNGEQANAMTQQAQCTRGMICLHQLQRTNYPDYRAVRLYMSGSVYASVLLLCLTVCVLMLGLMTVSLSECVWVLRCVYSCVYWQGNNSEVFYQKAR